MSRLKTVIGFLDNLSFDEDAEEIGKRKEMEAGLVREHMIETIEELFKSKSIPYLGPRLSMSLPVAGYLFKMGFNGNLKKLKKHVLNRFGLDESQQKRISGYLDEGDVMSLGMMAKIYSGNSPDAEWYTSDNARDFLTLAHNSYSSERQTKPYFILL